MGVSGSLPPPPPSSIIYIESNLVHSGGEPYETIRSCCFVFLSYCFSSVLHCIAFEIEGLTGNFLLSGLRFGLLHCAPPIPVSEERPIHTTSFLYQVLGALLFPRRFQNQKQNQLCWPVFVSFDPLSIAGWDGIIDWTIS